MLDKEDGCFVSSADFHDAISGFFLFFGGQPCDRFVEEKELGFDGEGPSHLDPFLNAVGTIRDPRQPVSLEIQELDDFLHRPALAEFFGPEAQNGMERISSKLHVPSQQQVVQRGHVEEETEILERPGNASPGDLVGREPLKALPSEEDFSLVGMVNVGNAVEQGRLSRAVRSDDGEDLFFFQREIDPCQGLDSSESNRQCVDLQ